MSKTWFTADHHFFHKNILEYCGRPFATVDTMNTALMIRHNEVVNPNDTVFFLGDFMLYIYEPTLRYLLKNMNGKKKILVRGNHDRISNAKYKNCGFDIVCKIMDYKGWRLTHWPIGHIGREHHRTINLCGHVHERWKTRGLSINVGVDVWDFYPVDEDTIRKTIKERELWNYHPF
jgi:calcineurin-like phosphoesterase family protein